MSVAFNSFARILDLELNAVFEVSATSEFEYTLNNIFTENDSVYLATKEYGILKSRLSLPNSYTEIHPEGPLDNDIFSITAQNNTLWVVYGGYSSAYVPSGIRKGFSNYNGEEWINTNFSLDFPFLDLVHVTIEPNNENKVFISSFAETGNGNIFSGGGLLEVENNEVAKFYNSQNSPLEDFQSNSTTRITTRISGSSFDSQGNLWIADALASKKLKKFCGLASYLRIKPSVGTIEVGWITYAKNLQKTVEATEAMYLMMKNIFENLGYRRYEWKCDNLNKKSNKAALRLGFKFEGVFRQMTISKGRNRDTAWFAIIDKEWQDLKRCFDQFLSESNFDNNGKSKVSLTSLTEPLLYKVDNMDCS